MYETVTVFGGGNAAFAVAACLSLKGKLVTLCDFPEFAEAIQPVVDANGVIDLISEDGPMMGKAKLDRVTTDVPDAVRTADLLVICSQAAAHGRLAREAAGHLRDGQHVLLLPGSCFGAYEFRKNLDQQECHADLVVAESNTLVFAARRTSTPNQVNIKHWATEVFIGALPASDTEKILGPFRELFPQCAEAQDGLETCLLNLNPYVHSAPAVLSISAVELSCNEFRHYVDGITPSTAKVMMDLDNERIAVCNALGYRDWSAARIFYQAGYMGQLTGDWVADMQSKPVLREAKGPFSIAYRYYTEDTGVGLTVIHSIGQRLGLAMPTHHALIHLTGVMSQTDYFEACTRDLNSLEIEGETPEALRSAFS